MEKQIIHRGRISWALSDNSITAFDNLQATIYDRFGASSDVAIEYMKFRVRHSKENELNSWVDVIELANRCGVVGRGTSIKPKISS